MATQQDYIRKSEMERCALMKLLPAIFKSLDGHYITYYFTPSDGYDCYDFYVMVFDQFTHSITHRFIGECKIRDRYYPSLLLEEKKWKDLKKKADESDAKVLYVNVTPKGTYTFNLSKLINDDTEWVDEDHWVSTTDKSLGKKKKWVTYISTAMGKWIYHTTDQVELDYNKGQKVVEEEVKKHKRQFCLFRDVLGRNED